MRISLILSVFLSSAVAIASTVPVMNRDEIDGRNKDSNEKREYLDSRQAKYKMDESPESGTENREYLDSRQVKYYPMDESPESGPTTEEY
ncbi:hypothetical protein EDB87DRAFT_297917 [Lactarius vividus]|nr:hypothetical protein EDB87DRAFT_297917 [Lactarius vividus]